MIERELQAIALDGATLIEPEKQVQQTAQPTEPNATPAGSRGGSQEWCDKPGETGISQH